ncbi:uncharacterized protein LOC144877784 [Branchiostoma floridae x Branchiostoma japonicum]
MIVLSIVVLVLLHHLGSSTAQVGSEVPDGWPVTEVGEHITLTGSCLAYGELLQYLTRQDKLEGELEALKNETQQCCEGQWTQQLFSSLQGNIHDQSNILQQQQTTVQQLQATVDEQANIIQQQQATMQQQQMTIQQQETMIQQTQTLLNQLSDKINGPRDCMDLLTTGHDTSGVYTIYPDGGGKSPVHVYCDMDTDGGGWTLFQKRRDGSINFYQDWQAYKTGFGDLRGEFWLGNDNLHRLAAQDVYELRVDLEDFEGNTAYAKYNIFRVEDEVHKYRLTVDGYSGTAGDAMTDPARPHNGMYFSTRDRDNDPHSTADCAEMYKGAWWYERCHRANLNGLYLGGAHQSDGDGVNWNPWKGSYYSLKITEMKIRPVFINFPLKSSRMAVFAIFILVLLHELSSTVAQVGSEEPVGWTVTDVGEHVSLTGSCLAYGELLQYLNRQDMLESELEGLKNETKQCCEGQWALWNENQQQSFSSLQGNLNDQSNVLQQQQSIVQQLQATVDDQVNILQQQEATMQQLQATVGEQAIINQQQQATVQQQQTAMQQLQTTVDDQANVIQQQETIIQQTQTLLSQLSDKLNGPRDCMELLTTGHDTSGVYTIYPDGGGKGPVHVYCDMDIDGGGWTLFQKRQDGSVNFYRDWEAYRTGFGDLRGEFWLGNDHLHRLTAQDVYELRVDLEDFDGNTAYAKYNIFRVEDEVHKYRLTVSGYSGTAGDGFTDPIRPHDGMYFSTRDRENDNHSTTHCAQVYKGAWWYNNCHHACLNGLYLGGVHQSSSDGVNWYPWKGSNYSLKTTEMKIRPNGSAAQVGSEVPEGWPVTEVGEHVTLTGSCLAYGELLQYLTRQDKLESELEALKNETQQCSTVVFTTLDKLNGPRDCMELLTTGHDTSGVYTIYPDGGGKSPVHVYCDMDTDGGGWTLFQKRQDGSVNFYQDWQAYKTGFGDLRGEFWLGNDHLHRLTAQNVYELRVDLEDFEGNTAYAKYNIFRVEDEVHKYRLTVSGYSGTAGDAMTGSVHPHNGMFFSTRDRENDIYPTDNCAQVYKVFPQGTT